MKRITTPARLPDDLQTLPEIADLIKIEPKTVYRWAASWLPVYKLGARCLRFSKREVLEAIAKRRINGAGE
ncbi:MAG: helix-turn-helix domain-containing protein [Verrucomicrobia bacterium]|nr:helix-turn-helix domain-containing protein [Verrucomicrobiota bacterium]